MYVCKCECMATFFCNLKKCPISCILLALEDADMLSPLRGVQFEQNIPGGLNINHLKHNFLI